MKEIAFERAPRNSIRVVMVERDSTTCIRGHEFTHRDRRGGRRCDECRKIRRAAARARQRS